jgi:hypothetical protein
MINFVLLKLISYFNFMSPFPPVSDLFFTGYLTMLSISRLHINWTVSGSNHGLTEVYYPRICLEGLRKTTEKLSQDNQCHG